jgi:SAM-dependent methyltransferase
MGAAASPLVDFLARHPMQGEVLVPGCGSGHDVRALAARGARVIGLDLSATAISLARSFPASSDETYEQGDLFQLPPSWHGRFDWVVEHTCFCAIDPSLRSDFVRAISELLKPGGVFFAIFYLDPQADQGPPFRTSREEIAELFDPQFSLLEEWVPARSFEGRAGRELCQLRNRRS